MTFHELQDTCHRGFPDPKLFFYVLLVKISVKRFQKNKLQHMLLHDRQIIIGDCRIHIVAVPASFLMRQHMDEILPMCISFNFSSASSIEPSLPSAMYCKLVRFLTFVIIQTYFFDVKLFSDMTQKKW